MAQQLLASFATPNNRVIFWRNRVLVSTYQGILTMFKVIRMQMDELGLEPDYRVKTLSELPTLLKSLA